MVGEKNLTLINNNNNKKSMKKQLLMKCASLMMFGALLLSSQSVFAQKTALFNFRAMAAQYGDNNVHNFTSSETAYTFRINSSTKPSVQTPDYGIWQCGYTFQLQNCTSDFGLRHYGAGKSYNDGLYTNNDRYIILQGLEAGDKMIVDYNKEDVSGASVLFPEAGIATFDNGGTPATNTQWGEVVDGKEYTATGTWLAIQQKAKSTGAYIYSISLTKQHEKISIGSDGFATFSSFYGLDFSTVGDKVKAYTAKLEGDKVVFEQVTGFVPANTGLFIQAIGGTTSVQVPTAETSAFSQDNELVGCPGGKKVTANDATAYTYVFGKSAADGLCFFKVADASEVSVPIGKAYLSTTTVASSRLSVSFDGMTTGIEEFKAPTQNDNAVYNLQGIKASTVSKGRIYIQNGKKYVK